MEWPWHGIPSNAGAGFVHVLDRVLIPPQVLEHTVYGVHSDQLPCTGSGTAKEGDLSQSIWLPWFRGWGEGAGRGGWHGVRREKIWDLRGGGGGERTELPSPRPLPFLHLYSPQTKPPPPRPKQLRRHTLVFYSLRLTRLKFVYSWFNKGCSAH